MLQNGTCMYSKCMLYIQVFVHAGCLAVVTFGGNVDGEIAQTPNAFTVRTAGQYSTTLIQSQVEL